MTTRVQVEAIGEICSGSCIEVQHKGVRHFTGVVTELMPQMNLLWAISSAGERRIVELDDPELTILLHA